MNGIGPVPTDPDRVAIVGVEAFRVRLPLVHEFETSSHPKSYLEHILVRLTDADGATGWGEIASPSGPFFSAETVESCWAMPRDHLAPLPWRRTGSTRPAGRALGRVRGNDFAKAGFDMACWALWSQARACRWPPRSAGPAQRRRRACARHRATRGRAARAGGAAGRRRATPGSS